MLLRRPSFIGFVILAACGVRADAGSPAEERGRMVTKLVAQYGIDNAAVLRAMRAVPRHEFVPTAVQDRAYADSALPIAHDQTISQPFIVAFMTQALELEPTDKVLEVGTGSGYQAAILGEIVEQVYSIEIVEPLGRQAAALLTRLGYDNVSTRIGDGYRGWPELAPFDAIIVTAAPDHVPQPLVDQLAAGGRMIVPVGDRFQELILLQKTAEGVVQRELLSVRFVPMTGEAERR